MCAPANMCVSTCDCDYMSVCMCLLQAGVSMCPCVCASVSASMCVSVNVGMCKCDFVCAPLDSALGRAAGEGDHSQQPGRTFSRQGSFSLA